MGSTFGAMMTAMALNPGVYPMQVIEGKFPDDVSGYSFVVGPAPKPGLSFFHTPGMVHRLNLTPNPDGTLTWQAGYLISEGMQVVGMLPPEVRQNPGLMMMIGMISNAANTALVPIQDGRMLATFDVGRPVEIDPINLRYLTGVGYHREWKAFIPGVVQPAIRTPAHPYYDQFEKQLYTINYTSTPKNGTSLTENELDMWVARWDGEGAVQKWHVSNATFTQYVHESLTTKNFVVWLDAAVFLTEPGTRYGLPRTRPQNPYTDIAIVRKSDLQPGVTDVKATVVRIPLEAGHMIADYDDDGKNITIYLAHANGAELPITVQADDKNFFSGETVDPSAVGMYTQTDATPYGRYVIDTERGEVVKSQLINDPERFWGLALQARDIRPPAIGTNKTIYMSYLGHDPLCVTEKMMNFYGNHPYRIVPKDKMPDRLIPSLLTQVDMTQMETVDVYEFAPGLVNSSPVFIPGNHNSAGYILTQVWDEKTTQLWLFDGSKIGAGPIAKLANPSFQLPFTVHTAWLPELKPRTSKYQVDFAEDIGNDYKMLPDFVRQAVETVIKERKAVAV